jgi:addiction module HigA family antidote
MPCLWTIETTTEVLLMRMHNPPHPGEVLRDYLGGVSITDAAKHLGVTRAAVSRILNGRAGISAEMALRLSEALRTSPELWIGMQAQYDLWQASKRRRAKVPHFAIAAREAVRVQILSPRPRNSAARSARDRLLRYRA